MALIKIYRAAQQWNEWLTGSPGHRVLQLEKKFLQGRLLDCYGKHGVLIGVPTQDVLLKAGVTACQTVLTPLANRQHTKNILESDLHALPIATGSVDLVFLPHSLEYIDNPRQLLTEACRIVKPEGHIVVLGFNPYSLWGLKKLLGKSLKMPWKNHFIQPNTVKTWLKLLDFEMVRQDFMLYGLPLHHYHTGKIVEWLGHACVRPAGGVYMLIARAKTIPLTPIRLRWQQTFSNIRISMPKPSMRKF